MANHPPQAPVYKEITLPQLRSFCETARRGSLTGAAAALGLAHPTVWKQVHALEKTFGTPLIEPFARGCRLTEAGQILLALTVPTVDNLDNLRARFDEALNNVEIRLTVAGAPRLLGEDLTPCLAEFVTRWPRARFTLADMDQEKVAATVEEGEADLGFTTNIDLSPRFAHVSIEPWYHLDVILITPRDHPLAHRRHVRPKDLGAYPLVNAWNTLRDPMVHGTVVKLGLYRTQPRWVEARQTAIIRRCVEQGLGIALVSGRPSSEAHPRLHERVMSRYFGQSTVHLVRRAGFNQHPAVTDFAEMVRARLGSHGMGHQRHERGKPT
jgi:DNA-binding transcriptional LysR family regulator